MSSLNEIGSESEFESITESGVSVVEFWAEWCGPCKAQIPVFDMAIEELDTNGVKASYNKINVDTCPEIAKAFKVQSVPCTIILKNGKPEITLFGLQRKVAIVNAVTAVCNG